MKIADIPTKFPIPFADSAGVGYINTIPEAASPTPGKASLETGFPPLNFEQIASGGIPPWGADMNGLQNQITKWIQWSTAGGLPVKYDSSFSASIGGYPEGAMLRAATLGNGKYWISTVDDNTTNPDTGGANWTPYPNVVVQIQADNYAVDTGAVNAMVITLSRVPASWSEIVGSPIRIGNVAFTNSSTTPTVKINSLTAATMVNADNTAISVSQIPAGCIVDGIPRSDGKFQVSSPWKPATAAANPFITGAIYWWPNETVPSGTLECNGATLLIASYPALYAILGTRYGGDGVTTFKLPDVRGEFIRGWDHGRGLDPNASTRTNAGGGITGDHVGTNQVGAAGSISISNATFKLKNPIVEPQVFVGAHFPLSTTDGVSSGWNLGLNTGGNSVDALSGAADITGSSGSETRPVNIYLMPIIGT